MRKTQREVTRKNQKTDEPAFAAATAWQAADYAGVTDSGAVGAATWISVGVRRGGRPTIVIGCNSAVAACQIFLNNPISVLASP